MKMDAVREVKKVLALLDEFERLESRVNRAYWAAMVAEPRSPVDSGALDYISAPKFTTDRAGMRASLEALLPKKK